MAEIALNGRKYDHQMVEVGEEQYKVFFTCRGGVLGQHPGVVAVSIGVFTPTTCLNAPPTLFTARLVIAHFFGGIATRIDLF